MPKTHIFEGLPKTSFLDSRFAIGNTVWINVPEIGYVELTIQKIEITDKGISYVAFGDYDAGYENKYHYYKQFDYRNINVDVFINKK